MQVVDGDRRSDRGRGAAAFGAASVLLLLASFQWAHHWGPRTDVLVAAWAATTFGALFASSRALHTDTIRRRAAKLGLACALLSVAALAIAGLAYAAGADPAGACGGG